MDITHDPRLPEPQELPLCKYTTICSEVYWLNNGDKLRLLIIYISASQLAGADSDSWSCDSRSVPHFSQEITPAHQVPQRKIRHSGWRVGMKEKTFSLFQVQQLHSVALKSREFVTCSFSELQSAYSFTSGSERVTEQVHPNVIKIHSDVDIKQTLLYRS